MSPIPSHRAGVYRHVVWRTRMSSFPFPSEDYSLRTAQPTRCCYALSRTDCVSRDSKSKSGLVSTGFRTPPDRKPPPTSPLDRDIHVTSHPPSLNPSSRRRRRVRDPVDRCVLHRGAPAPARGGQPDGRRVAREGHLDDAARVLLRGGWGLSAGPRRIPSTTFLRPARDQCLSLSCADDTVLMNNLASGIVG